MTGCARRNHIGNKWLVALLISLQVALWGREWSFPLRLCAKCKSYAPMLLRYVSVHTKYHERGIAYGARRQSTLVHHRTGGMNPKRKNRPPLFLSHPNCPYVVELPVTGSPSHNSLLTTNPPQAGSCRCFMSLVHRRLKLHVYVDRLSLGGRDSLRGPQACAICPACIYLHLRCVSPTVR